MSTKDDRAVIKRFGSYGYSSTFLGDPFEGARSTPLPELPMPTTLAFGPLARLDYVHYSVSFCPRLRCAAATACNIDGAEFWDTERGGRSRWQKDERVASEDQVGDEFYRGSGLDRGHLTRRQDVCWGPTLEAALEASDATFSYANACPQAPDFNQSASKWHGLELYLLEDHAIASSELDAPLGRRAIAITGPVIGERDHFATSAATGERARVPLEFYKVVAVAARCERGPARESLMAAAFVMSQEGEEYVDSLTGTFARIEARGRKSSRAESYVGSACCSDCTWAPGRRGNPMEPRQVSIAELERKTKLEFALAFHEADALGAMRRRSADEGGDDDDCTAQRFSDRISAYLGASAEDMNSSINYTR
jgi:endonuclease G